MDSHSPPQRGDARSRCIRVPASLSNAHSLRRVGLSRCHDLRSGQVLSAPSQGQRTWWTCVRLCARARFAFFFLLCVCVCVCACLVVDAFIGPMVSLLLWPAVPDGGHMLPTDGRISITSPKSGPTSLTRRSPAICSPNGTRRPSLACLVVIFPSCLTPPPPEQISVGVLELH